LLAYHLAVFALARRGTTRTFGSDSADGVPEGGQPMR
jgi:hypothetical protein